MIGRRVVPLLIAQGHRVTAVARSADKGAELERAGAKPVELELFDRNAAQRAMAGHDAVINLATHIPASSARMILRRSWRENDRIRRDGSAALVGVALDSGVRRFIQESFAPIYADGGDAWLDERSPVDPAPYNRTVLDAERNTERMRAAGEVGVALRFGYFYDTDSMLVTDLLRSLRSGWFGLPGAAHAFISSVTHGDAATAVVAALGARSGIYNVVDDEPLRRRDFANALAGAFRRKDPRMPPAWLSRIGGSTIELLSRSQRIANRKFRWETGWVPCFPSAREGWRAIAADIDSSSSA